MRKTKLIFLKIGFFFGGGESEKFDWSLKENPQKYGFRCSYWLIESQKPLLQNNIRVEVNQLRELRLKSYK